MSIVSQSINLRKEKYMQIHVPEDVGGEDLRLFPEDTYSASLSDWFLGKGKASQQPKLTAKWVVTSEPTDPDVTKRKDFESTIGSEILDTYSLQPQALWKLNGLYKQVTGEKLPHGDFDAEGFHQMIKETLTGVEADLDIVTDTGSGEERSMINKVMIKK